jgi:hypothetical protein
MTKQLISTLSIILLLGSAPVTGVSANSNIDFRALNFTGGIGFDSKLNWPQPFTVKKGESYDEAKDPFYVKAPKMWKSPRSVFLLYRLWWLG